MKKSKSTWLSTFAHDAAGSDQFQRSRQQRKVLALGLLGEAGSVLAEAKKSRREGHAYAAQQERVEEEIGDFLWYFVRLLTLEAPELLPSLHAMTTQDLKGGTRDKIGQLLGFGASVGKLLEVLRSRGASRQSRLRESFQNTWGEFLRVTANAEIPLREAAEKNIQKRADRWPITKSTLPVFDLGFPKLERFPRQLEVEFIERGGRRHPVVVLRSNGIVIGDRLTDSIEEPDEYRFHDVFHLTFGALLGWSPVTRGLLQCKRKSNAEIDENQDGGRALVVEEAIAALVFARAKEVEFFQKTPHLDYDLLKLIQELTRGYEVEQVPLWQWEHAILRSYSVFRRLRAKHGGRVVLDFGRRTVDYRPPRLR